MMDPKKNFRSENNFDLIKILGPKKFGIKKILDPKKFWYKKIFGPRKVLGPKKKFWSEKI